MLKRIRILTALLVFALVLSIVPAAYAGSGLPDVTRLAGNTRYETSVLVAETFFTSPTQAVIAYGENFPDGLSGSPLANTVGAPLILTRAGKEAAAAKYVADTGITGGYALGGTTVLPEKTVEKIFPAVTTPEPTECAHTYNNDCDADCNLCCAARTPADHVYDDAYDADCNVCGEGRTPAVRPMQIVQQPQDALIPSGGAEHTFTVVVSGGTEPYSYQWQYQNSLVPEFTDIDEFSRAFCSGFQTASMSLELYSTDFDRGTQFRCIITDARGEKIITNAVKVIENIPPLKITGQPTDVSAEIYDLVVYTVVAEGGKGSYTYQWQFMSNMQPNWMDITHDQGGLYSGYETADLQVNVISDHYNDAYQFRCVVTDSRGESVTSDAAFLHQFVPLTVYVEPRDIYTSTGGYHEFAVTVGSGLPTYTYQWYWKMDGVGMAMPFDGTEGWGAVGYNTATLGLTASTDMLENNFYVFCRISDQSGDEVETRKAYVLQSFEVHTYTASQGMNVGRTVEISVSVRGGKAPYTYQLQRRFGFNDTFKNYGAAKTG